MCGIAGVLLIRENELSQERTKEIIKQILRSQQQRGPDYEGLEELHSPQLAGFLGHNRLSIVDLSPMSNQPMWDETKRFCITYNGMLYNYLEIRSKLLDAGYQFFSTGDTEVVLKAFMHWGVSAFALFNGMFALGIFDQLDQVLYLVRDRFGVKPLFYGEFLNQFYFASTSNELASQFKLQTNMNEVVRGLQYWCYGSSNETIYQSLFSVAPCEVLTVQYKKGWLIEKQSYYSITHQVNQLIPEFHHADTKNLIEQVKFNLQEAIHLRLRSDVPMSVSLSGGIDSAVIASLSKKKNDSIVAFTFGSPLDRHSEAAMASQTAKHIGIPLKYVSPTREELFESFSNTLLLQDAPFPNFSIAAQYLVFAAAKREGFKVMLGGQGGDEIFMGYRKYFLFYLKKLFHEKQYTKFFHLLTGLLPTLLDEVNKLPFYMFQSHRYRQGNVLSGEWQAYRQDLNLKLAGIESLWQRQVADLYHYSLPSLLRYEDRNSMGNAIESRLPFLDYRLVELALALPDTTKIRHGLGKWILRQSASDYVSKEILFSRRKKGFEVQTQRWLDAGVGVELRKMIGARADLLSYFKLKGKVNEYCSDAALIKHPRRLAESLSLAWLATKNHFVWG